MNDRLFLGVVFILALPAAAAADDWPQWRGPRRDGISEEKGLLKEWPEGGPKLLWTAEKAGGGYSTVAVTGGKVFTQGDREDGCFLIAYDAATGKEAWAAPNGPIYPNSRGGGPRGAPTVDGELAYALSGSGHLVCAESKTGKVRFELDVFREFQAQVPHWGVSESPLVEKDLLIVTPGGSAATVAALDKRTGKTVWKAAAGRDRAGYSSTIALDAAGVRQVVAFTSRALIGVAASDGRVLWRHEKAANGVANVATPIARGDQVFVSSDYGTGAALLKLVKDGEGVKAEEVYFSKRMQNHHATCVLWGDHLFGPGDKNGAFTCMEFATGKVIYPGDQDRRSARVQKGGLVYADAHFYCLGEEGEMALVEANPKELVVKSRFKPFGMTPDPNAHGSRRNTWSHPVIAGGKLYLREQDNLYVYNVKRG